VQQLGQPLQEAMGLQSLGRVAISGDDVSEALGVHRVHWEFMNCSVRCHKRVVAVAMIV
jgi:hypothetical protein